MTLFNGYYYFSADDGVHGEELWRTDCTEAGTTMVKDINPSGGSYPGLIRNSSEKTFLEHGNYLYFVATDGTHGRELWKTDGTAAGTQLVKDINTNANAHGNVMRLESFGDKIVFMANDDSNGAELWITDGTTAGTQLVKDIRPGAIDSSPRGFLEFNNYIYFRADDGSNGAELWRTDGTAAGTALFKDIWTGSNVNSSNPGYLVKMGNYFYFSAYDDTNRTELWRSDGTACRNRPVQGY